MSSSFKQATYGTHQDLSRSIMCSSFSSRLSTESYLMQKNFNVFSHYPKGISAELARAQSKQELYKQLSFKSQFSLKNKLMHDISMSSASMYDIEESSS